MSVTARSTIQGALKLLTVLDPTETMSPDDANDGLVMLNNMVDSWNLERLSIFTTGEVVASFNGASATIGPSMTFDTARPIRIESAFYRKSGIDYPLEVIEIAAYNAIVLKTTAGDYPEVLFYDGGAPTGSVTVWPVPTSNSYHLIVMQQLTAFADLDTTYDLPQGYARALMFKLCEEMATTYGKDIKPSITKIATSAYRALKRANIDAPRMDLDLPGNSNDDSGRINILSGR